MKTINSNTAVKYKAFAYYKQKYHRNLNETNSLIEPLNLLCGGCNFRLMKGSSKHSSKLLINFQQTSRHPCLSSFQIRSQWSW